MKTALSVIEDTLIARNRLYLWIYAHHKVAYNDYLLRQGILWSYLSEEDACLPQLERMKKADRNFSQTMDVRNIFMPEEASENYLLEDGDLIYRLKRSLFQTKGGCRNKFGQQWISREHMHPVWKSYVEYNNFFSNLSSAQRKKLWSLLFNRENITDTQNQPEEANIEEYDNSVLKEIDTEIDLRSKYVWIKPAGFKLKEMKVSDIFIVLSDESVKRLKDVMSQEKVTEQYVDESFFYLYTSQELSPEKKLQLVSSLKTKVKNNAIR